MSYSQTRLRRTLALVRFLTGILFLSAGLHKVASWEFARIEFPQFLWDATHGGAAAFYSDFLSNVVAQHIARYAAVIAFCQLFIGIGLVLGLAIRPVSVLGMLYSLHLILATWNASPGMHDSVWGDLEGVSNLLLMLFLFLLLGVGHAGERWGLGALYHRHRQSKAVQAYMAPEGEEALTARISLQRDFVDADKVARQAGSAAPRSDA